MVPESRERVVAHYPAGQDRRDGPAGERVDGGGVRIPRRIPRELSEARIAEGVDSAVSRHQRGHGKLVENDEDDGCARPDLDRRGLGLVDRRGDAADEPRERADRQDDRQAKEETYCSPADVGRGGDGATASTTSSACRLLGSRRPRQLERERHQEGGERDEVEHVTRPARHASDEPGVRDRGQRRDDGEGDREQDGVHAGRVAQHEELRGPSEEREDGLAHRVRPDSSECREPNEVRGRDARDAGAPLAVVGL